MRYRVKGRRSISLSGGRVAAPGDELELDEDKDRAVIGSSRVEPLESAPEPASEPAPAATEAEAEPEKPKTRRKQSAKRADNEEQS